MCEAKRYGFTAMTDVWTGSADGKSNTVNSVGLLGSVRWWYENLIRWMGGYACDPNDDNPEERCNGKDHCVACEFFGCTGWARKFRFGVYDESGEAIKHKQIKKGDVFSLCFDPIRPISDVEWALLHMTMRLISDYGAIGGRTTSMKRNKFYGIVSFKAETVPWSLSKDDLYGYVRRGDSLKRQREASAVWGADSENFLHADYYIPFSNKNLPDPLNGVGGKKAQDSRSRRIFTFKWKNTETKKEAARTFYFSPDEESRGWLEKKVFPTEILSGKRILEELIAKVVAK